MIRVETDLIWSDATTATARLTAEGWELSWAPGRTVEEYAARWAMELADQPPSRFSEGQLACFTGLYFWQVRRAREADAIPEPDGTEGGEPYWSPDAARAVAADAVRIAEAAGSIPDIGVHRAAGELRRRLGIPVTVDAVIKLARQGLLPVAGEYRGHTLYCGRAIAAFEDAAAAAEAAVDGHMLTDTEAAEFLQIRESDFRHLVRLGFARPVPWNDRHRSSTPWRTGDLARIEADNSEIDWAAVRDTRKGKRSALAALPTPKTKTT